MYHVSSDNTVWMTSGHFPMNLPLKELPFTCDKVYLITRNPIDVFVSMFQFLNTGSHSMILEEKMNETFSHEWDEWIKTSTRFFKEFHQVMIEKIGNEVPIYFARYEDVTNSSEHTLIDIFKFILN